MIFNQKPASFATLEENSKGRLYQEKDNDCKHRSIFGRDRDRVINSRAFRRLQYKTQVFVNHEGDHYRTRLTHSLEVAQIARWIAGALNVNKDLAEVVSLAHDLGHPPFGHAGEDALHEKMKNFGGFFHNINTLKIITEIEQRFIAFSGLNLSWEMIEGVAKHNGPIKNLAAEHFYLQEYNKKHDLDLSRFASIEAQIAGISDDIAYNNHDLEDGIRAGLFEIEQVFDLPLVGEIYQKIRKEHGKIANNLLVLEAKRKLTSAMVLDVIEQTEKNIKNFAIVTADDVRNCDKELVSFSPEFAKICKELKNFLMKNMYRHYKINRMSANAKKIVGGLFDFYMENPSCLPDERGNLGKDLADKNKLATLISDYIAGMTDRFAIKEYKELVIY